MEHSIGEEGLETLTFQGPFAKSVPCSKCGKNSPIALVVAEGGEGQTKYACNLYDNDPRGAGFWLHDAAAFAIYMCRDIQCTTATTKWNQA